jgi:putative nucleotidyltransferase with HDIG domain
MAIPDKLLNGIEKLDPLPATVQKLVVTLDNENVDINEIVEVIEYDPAVTSNILKIANSPIYGGRAQINRIRDAVVRLGTATLLDILLVNQTRSLRVAAPLYDLTEDDLWLHGAAASLAAKAIMKETRNSSIPKNSSIAALLHDIGKLIMVRYLDAQVSTIIDLCKEKGFTFVEAEAELFSCTHADVGGAIAEKWGFPENIARAIALHHQMPIEKPEPTLDVVVLSNLVSKAIGVGLGAEGLNLKADSAGCRERLGLTTEGFERVCLQTVLWLDELKRSYGVTR